MVPAADTVASVTRETPLIFLSSEMPSGGGTAYEPVNQEHVARAGATSAAFGVIAADVLEAGGRTEGRSCGP